MEIEFRLDWAKPGKPVARAFKLKSAYELAEEYAGRIRKFVPCKILGQTPAPKAQGTQTWMCSREGRMLSSEALAGILAKLNDGGVRRLVIWIGGPDGFSTKTVEECRPELEWSFGPLTLPHELAAGVACEQMYRAWTIIRNLPYHKGHI